jgi:hypothetical protein
MGGWLADLICISGALITFIFTIIDKYELMTLHNNYVGHYPLSKVYEIYCDMMPENWNSGARVEVHC